MGALRGPRDIGDVRDRNCHSVLEQLRTGRKSRAEISRCTGLGRSTVTGIVNFLMDVGLIAETNDQQRGAGRPGQLLRLADESFVLAGVELGRRETYLCLFDLHGESLGTCAIPGIGETEPTEALTALKGHLDDLLDTVPNRRLLGIGIGVPSPVDPAEPGRLSPTILPRWEGLDLRDELSAYFGAPVYVDNDANMGAFGQYWWHGTEAALVFLKMGSGVGCGFCSQGRVHYGLRGVAGEIGHLSIDPNGALCVCGQRGCLVTFVGADALRARSAELLGTPPNEGSIEMLMMHAAAGSPEATEYVEHLLDMLTTGLTSVINTFAPELVIISGTLEKFGPRYIEALQARINAVALLPANAQIQLSLAPEGRAAVAHGAAARLMHSVFRHTRAHLTAERSVV